VDGGENVVAIFVGHFDVADDQIESSLLDEGDGLAAGGGRVIWRDISAARR